jgi:hypothetical protein
VTDHRPRVFISYSHDSPAHKEQVRTLAGRLREDGIACEIDQYVESPPEGWPEWMLRRVQESDFVLVIATAEYRDRFEAHTSPTVGRGSRWEGAIITQALYDSAGRNEKFVPVVFRRGDVETIPSVLHGATYYEMDTRDGYERLYRRLTAQPAVPRPALGQVRSMPPVPSAERAFERTDVSVDSTAPGRLGLVMVFGQDPRTILIQVEQFEASADRITMTLIPGEPAVSNTLRQLQPSTRDLIGVGVDLTTRLGRLREIVQRFREGREEWTVTLTAVQYRDVVDSFMELSLAEMSADQIAELRLRRLLLNENPPTASSTGNPLDSAFLEVLVAGMNVPLPIKHSPFPPLYRDLGDRPSMFLAAARLIGSLWAVLCGAVETVDRCDVMLTPERTLHVSFAGRRARHFTNVEPAMITVEGDCKLIE